MESFEDKIAVITGGGTGMGRELARQLAVAGCHVAICDVSEDNMVQTKSICDGQAPAGTRITIHVADVSSEEDLMRFRNEVMREHETDCVNLVFNNAGIGNTGSMITTDRDDWERTFNICWYGVYYGTRTFLRGEPLVDAFFVKRVFALQFADDVARRVLVETHGTHVVGAVFDGTRTRGVIQALIKRLPKCFVRSCV